MHKYKKYYFLWVLVVLYTVNITAQRYPVQVTQNILPPYSTKLSDYVTAQDVKLRVNLLLSDIAVSNRKVRLKLRIKNNNGLQIQSSNVVVGAPQIFLNGGVLKQLTNIDLAAYFKLENLQGINPQTYSRSLPEGPYTFCWEVYDELTNQLISNPSFGCTSIYLVLNDPPFLNLPFKGDQIVAKDPMNLIFQWTPRHVNATNVSYEFELREIWDNKIDPQTAFLSSPNYYAQTTNTTSLLYNIGKPELFPGKKYAWRVRAKSTTGVSENSIFKNDGYSEIYYFTYTNKCYAPTFVLAESLGKNRAKVTWQSHPDHKKYHVQYKRTDIPDAQWFEVYTFGNQAQLGNLQPGKTYRIRVGGSCNELTEQPSFSYSNPIQVTTAAASSQPSGYTCGIEPEIKISNTKPLQNLGANETFTAGDFEITAKIVEGGNGQFTGKGYVVVPYLADTRIAVTFNNISINTDYQLIDGVINTTYDPTWGDMASTESLTSGGAGKMKTNTVKFPIKEVIKGPNGDIIIVGENGEIVELEPGEDRVITDSKGNSYSVDEKGNITNTGKQAEGGGSTPQNTEGVAAGGSATKISAKGVKVTFRKAPNSKFAFDAYDKKQSVTQKLYKKLGKNYYIPYKLVVKGKTDYIIADLDITDDAIKPHDIIFKTKDGVSLVKTDSTTTSYTLQLKGTFDDAEVETHAVVKQGDKYKVAGAFIQYQIAPKPVSIVLVNTSQSNTSTIKTKLENLYKAVGVNLSISEVANFNINNYVSSATLQSGESGFAAQYTKDQQKINKGIRRIQNYNPRAYYMVLTNKKPSKSGEKGLMPLGRQVGYIYSITANNVAHELAHGAFQLKHPFSKKSYGYPQRSTNWLLDYSGGTHLPFVHWKAMHNPKLRLGIFDNDSENELSSRIFLTADWKPFTFKNDTENKSIMTLPKDVTGIPQGAVPGIKYNGTTYRATGNNYINDAGKKLPIVHENESKTDSVYLFKYIERCNHKLYKAKWAEVKALKGQAIDFTSSIFSKKTIRVACKQEEFKNSCKQYTYYSVANEEDKAKLDDYQKQLDKALKYALGGIGIDVEKEYRSLGVYAHIGSTEKSKTLLKDIAELELLEDKLHLLAKKGPYVAVTFLKLDNNKYIKTEDIQNMAKTAISNSAKYANGKKIVYIVVPYANFESIFGVGFWNNDVCYNVGYAESESGIVTNGTTYHKKKKISDKILEIFTQIKKPLTINKYYQYANGEIRNYKYSLEENAAGYPFIKALRFYQSEAYIEAQKRRVECYKQRNDAIAKCNEEDNSIWSSCKSNAYDDFADCTNKIATYVKTSLQVEETEGSLAEMSYWKVISVDKIAKFREVYMDWDAVSNNHQNATYINQRNNLTGQLFDDIVKNWTYLAKVKIAMNWHEALEDKHFYNFDTGKVINDAAYGILDAIGTIPGADTFTDPIGAIYAGIRGDTENALIYSASFAIPFAGASYVKGGKKAITKADEVFGLVAKKANNSDGFELVYKQIDNIDPKEFQLTSVVQSLDKKIKNKVLPNDFKPYTNGDFIRSQLKRLSGVVDDLPNIVKGLGNLTEKESKQLLKDLNKSKRFKKLFISGDRASKLKCIDSWRILKEYKISICK